jgi:hypothetical protein
MLTASTPSAANRIARGRSLGGFLRVVGVVVVPVLSIVVRDQQTG